MFALLGIACLVKTKFYSYNTYVFLLETNVTSKSWEKTNFKNFQKTIN